MPLLQVNILEGRTPELKERLIFELTNTVCNVLEAPKESVRILINEIPSGHWGIAGESIQKRKEKLEE